MARGKVYPGGNTIHRRVLRYIVPGWQRRRQLTGGSNRIGWLASAASAAILEYSNCCTQSLYLV
jgi:hypothetical protein